MPENQTPYKKGKKKRETLRLPTLHFNAADDWMNKLTYEGFGAWLKFHTWVDRTDSNREYDKIPMSLEASWEKLGVSKSKFYRLIKPMWEFGLIDIIDYEASTRVGQKPKNIIVYEYPFHDETKMFLPLEKLRDWDKDYQSKSKDSGKIGGRPRKKIQDQDDEQPKPNDMQPKQNDEPKKEITKKTGENSVVDHRFKIKTVHGFKIKTVTVSKLKPNNVLNNSINYQITPNNYQKKNLSILKEIPKLNIPECTVDMLKKEIDRLILLNIKLIEIELAYKDYELKMSQDDFTSVLYDVLQVDKYKYGFKGYFRKSLDNKIVNTLKKAQGIVEQPKTSESSYDTDYSKYDFNQPQKPEDIAYKNLMDMYEQDPFKYDADFVDWVANKEIELGLEQNSPYSAIYSASFVGK
ncbi:hypothetical protein OCO53_25530 [Peribacillus frigoritolerans]|uniref:hypothetical protein n=1 Tax=Peribacillus frigoritolerans TaxID=450367 RepID=UPI0021D0436B|nr:hypothetical protein [Peribacillus frigoritolerans]MCU6603805.1 hypothetical protein [Peribacillus frigoritolerans]